MSLDTAMGQLSDALTGLEAKLAARIAVFEGDLARAWAERDSATHRLADLETQLKQAQTADAASLHQELEAMASAHDALLRRYGELERRFFGLQATTSQALKRLDGVIAATETRAVEERS